MAGSKAVEADCPQISEIQDLTTLQNSCLKNKYPIRMVSTSTGIQDLKNGAEGTCYSPEAQRAMRSLRLEEAVRPRQTTQKT